MANNLGKITAYTALFLSLSAGTGLSYNNAKAEEIQSSEQPTIVKMDTTEIIPPSDIFIRCDKLPVAIDRKEIIYPKLAKQKGIEGTVWVQSFVSKTGNVLEAKITKSSGKKVGFEAAALDNADDFMYKPAIRNNKPLGVWITYRVDFVLDNK